MPNIVKTGSTLFKNASNQIMRYGNTLVYNSIGSVTGTFSNPQFLSIDYTNNRIFICNVTPNTVAIYNLTTLAFVQNISITYNAPVGIAIDSANNRFFIVNQAANAVLISRTSYV